MLMKNKVSLPTPFLHVKSSIFLRYFYLLRLRYQRRQPKYIRIALKNAITQLLGVLEHTCAIQPAFVIRRVCEREWLQSNVLTQSSLRDDCVCSDDQIQTGANKSACRSNA